MHNDKFIDIDNVIKSKSRNLHKFLPSFVINYLKKIVHEDEINSLISKNKDFYGIEFTSRILKEYHIQIEIVGEEHIINNNKFIVASNHPLGGLDGIALLNHIGKYKPVKSITNDLLMNIDNLKTLFVPVNKHGKNPKEYVKCLNDTFDSDVNILYFPAGLVSRKKGKTIKDLEWKKSFLQKSVRYHRNIIPAFVNGRNSNFFYNLANIRTSLGIKTNIEMLYLVDEMYKHRGTTIKIIYGKPISYKVFHKQYDENTWAYKLREHSYCLEENPNKEFNP